MILLICAAIMTCIALFGMVFGVQSILEKKLGSILLGLAVIAILAGTLIICYKTLIDVYGDFAQEACTTNFIEFLKRN